MKLPTSVSSGRALTIAFLLSAVRTVHAGDLLESINTEVSSIFDKSKDAVVKIHATRQPLITGLPLVPAHRVGSGFFIDGEGRLLTAAAVVEDADKCWIDWRGQRVPAQIVARDLITNLAMLKVDPSAIVGAEPNTPFLALGNSDDLRAGSMVIAIGYPYDLACAPSVGFVGGIDIQRGTRLFVTSHIRTGCKLSPGQGGGPVLNTRGEVVGIAVAALPNGQSYALPINAAKKVVADFQQCGEARHGWVGLNVSQRRPAGTEPGLVETRVYVQQVFSNTPAALAGFQDDDLLLTISTNEVHHLADVLNTMFYYRAGDCVTFTVLRNGEKREVELVVGARPVEETTTTVLVPLPSFAPVRTPARPLPTVVPAVDEK